jgi:hypothetical protein
VRELKFAWDDETITAIQTRAVTLYEQIDGEHELPPLVQQSLFNSILHMVGQVEVGAIVVPNVNADLTRRNQG